MFGGTNIEKDINLICLWKYSSHCSCRCLRNTIKYTKVTMRQTDKGKRTSPIKQVHYIQKKNKGNEASKFRQVKSSSSFTLF